MRINKFIALATGKSRRTADGLIASGAVLVNGTPAAPGHDVTEHDHVTLHKQMLSLPAAATTIILNKPAGYVCSRRGQGSKTIYDLLPQRYHSLKSVGRLDKESSGLLLLTDDGELANRLTHPRYQKTKIYRIVISQPLSAPDRARLERGVPLDDGLSALSLKPLDAAGKHWQVSMQEGRNRQIRRTFAALGYEVCSLHRTEFGDYTLGTLQTGTFRTL